ncbi:TetR/AcrR family transcriptional regulator [Haloglycomyces albus]|uniref:TetR/AcrR family transcriptional regulator n=1 Tax=Haloglycomyces albus TaxID=526067 RepID=UPI0004B7AC09|nr:TetR/AcrR family transcriptional regulator [Haloglycomyces albus]
MSTAIVPSVRPADSAGEATGLSRSNDMAHNTGQHALRRLPVQERSAARVGRMLDAAADLIEEVGYDRLSTTAIAQKADVAIGSVYQFFGDKRSLAEALSQRYIKQYFERLEVRLNTDNPDNWRSGVAAAFKEYTYMYRTAPGFRVLHLADAIDPGKGSTIATGADVIAGHIATMLEDHYSVRITPNLRETIGVAVETGQALVRLAFRRDKTGDDAALAEAERVVCDYLERRLND